MGTTVKALINRTNRKNKSGLYSIYLRITINRKSKYFNIGVRLMEKYWRNKEGSWVKENHPHSHEVNTLIEKEINKLREYILRQKVFGKPVSLKSVSEFYKKSSDNNSFNEFVKNYLKYRRFGSLNTRKKYLTFQSHLNEYSDNIKFSNLNEWFFQDLAKWMKEKKCLSGVTVHKYFDAFKKICKDAVKDGYLEKDPFQYVNIGIKDKKHERVYLEINEIKRLKTCKITEENQNLLQVRKHWLFCFYAGFYYSDLRKLTWDKIISSDEGFCIVDNRFKNSNRFISPIYKFSHAIEIINSQKGKHEKLVFPKTLSEPKFNLKLKELATLAGIKKNLMNKTARHSYIQFWESLGLGTAHLAKMVGHTKESTTKEYYNLSLRDINSQLRNFDLTTVGV